MKRLICIILALVILLSMLPMSAFADTVNTEGIADPELVRALRLGIGTKAGNETVTYEQFFKMLDTVVDLADPSKLEKWQKTLPKTRTSKLAMTRSDGIAAVYYAAEALGEKYYSLYINDWGVLHGKMGNHAGASFNAYQPKEALFQGLREHGLLTYENENWDRFFAAYIYATSRRSQVSGNIIFDYDEVLNSICPDAPLTYKDAMLAALRLYESSNYDYVLPEELGTYQLSPEALAHAAAMPAVTPGSLPQWRGRELEMHNWGYTHDSRYLLNENDIAEIAGYGFNYIRLQCSNYYPYSHSNSLTAETEKGFVFNSVVMKNIGDMLGWCAKYGIHVCLCMNNVPGFGFLWRGDWDLLENAEHYQQSQIIWKTVSQYFSDVPSSLLSYEIINEPCDIFTPETYTKFANDCIGMIRAGDRKNKVIVSGGMDGNKYPDAGIFLPVDTLDNSIVQSIHFYPYNALRQSQFISFLNWPFDEAPVVNASYYSGKDPLTLLGDFAPSTQIVLYLREVDGVNQGTQLRLYADGVPVDSFTINNIREGKDNCDHISGNYASFGYNGETNGYEVTLNSPKAAKKLAIYVKGQDENFNVTYREVLVKSPTDVEKLYYVPDNAHEGIITQKGYWNTTYFYCSYVNEGKSEGSTVMIEGDGTYTASPVFEDVYIFDYNFMRQFFAEWSAWSKKTGTQLIVNEFYIPSLMPASAKTAYLESFLSVLDEYDIPWCYYNSTHSGPLVFPDINTEVVPLLTDEMGYVHKGAFWIDMAAMKTLQKYMK